MHVLLNVFAAVATHSIHAVPSVTGGETPALARVGVMLFVLGLTCDAYLVYRFFFSNTTQLSGRDCLKVSPPTWGLRELALATAAILGAFSIINILYLLLTAYSARDWVPLMIISNVLLELSFLAAAAQFFLNRGIGMGTAFGLRAISTVDALHWGVVFGLGSLPPVQLLVMLSEKLLQAFGLKSSEQEIAELFTITNSRPLLILLVIFAVIIAPVFEECFFRGFAYPVLKQRLGMWRGLVVVSGVFAISHAHLPSVAPLFVLALGFGLSYELTGSLLVPITMHALFNSIMVAQLIYERTHP